MSGEKASTGGMSKSTGGTPTYNADKIKANRVAKEADKYAQNKLGITTTVAGPVAGASSTPTGFYSTTSSNQMYGSEYQAARNEYLASQGLGTVRADGGYMAGVQTDKGLVFTSEGRNAYNASRNISMPLSRQMYDSQQTFKQVTGAILTGLSGMPSFFSAAYYASRKPYSQYVGEYMSGSKKGVDNSTISPSKKNQNKKTITIKDTPKVANDFDAAARGDEKALKRVQTLAKSGEAGSPNRKFLVSSAKTFLGKMKSGTLDADYSTF